MAMTQSEFRQIRGREKRYRGCLRTRGKRIMSQQERAGIFSQLHQGPELLVLANAWDAASAALIADAGAKAVATSSAAVAWARGYPDGDALPVPVLIAAIADIARVISAPLTADIEGGYSDDLTMVADTVTAVVQAGAVGINFEDGAREPELHVRKIEAARKAADRAGVGLFINARIDVYLYGLAKGDAAMVESLRRAKLYQSAGASGIFVPGPTDESVIENLAREIALPLNVMGRDGMPGAARLQSIGVRRLSSATAPFNVAYAAMSKAISAYLKDGDSGALARSGAGLPNLNKRFKAASGT